MDKLDQIKTLCERVLDVLEHDGEYHAEDLADQVLAIHRRLMEPNIMCSCGILIHPDMPNVVPDMDSADKPLWHEDGHGWHEVD